MGQEPPSLSRLELRRLLEKTAPSLRVKQLAPLDEGWKSRAFLVNNEWVFRFPKNLEAVEDLSKETQILPQLCPRLTLRIPEFKIIGTQPDGQPFVGYPFIPGSLLSVKPIHTLPEKTSERIARQLAQFMDEIQPFPIREATRLGVKTSDLVQEIQKNYRAIRRFYSDFPPSVCLFLDMQFGRYLQTRTYHRFTPKLIHGNLTADHLVFAENKTGLAGVIDFCDLAVTDPDQEYCPILSDKSMGLNLTRRIMELRKEKNLIQLIEKVELFRTFHHVKGILEGKKHEYPRIFHLHLHALLDLSGRFTSYADPERKRVGRPMP